jgi:hypothetical protein
MHPQSVHAFSENKRRRRIKKAKPILLRQNMTFQTLFWKLRMKLLPCWSDPAPKLLSYAIEY